MRSQSHKNSSFKIQACLCRVTSLYVCIHEYIRSWHRTKGPNTNTIWLFTYRDHGTTVNPTVLYVLYTYVTYLDLPQAHTLSSLMYNIMLFAQTKAETKHHSIHKIHKCTHTHTHTQTQPQKELQNQYGTYVRILAIRSLNWFCRVFFFTWLL